MQYNTILYYIKPCRAVLQKVRCVATYLSLDSAQHIIPRCIVVIALRRLSLRIRIVSCYGMRMCSHPCHELSLQIQCFASLSIAPAATASLSQIQNHPRKRRSGGAGAAVAVAASPRGVRRRRSQLVVALPPGGVRSRRRRASGRSTTRPARSSQLPS